MVTLANRGILLDATRQPPDRQVACFTSLCVLRSGRIICGCQNGPAKHAPNSTLTLLYSDDQGETWLPLPAPCPAHLIGITGSVGAAEMVEASPGRLLLFVTWFDRTDPARPLFDPATDGLLKSKQLMSVSHDDGQSWSAWRELPTAELRACALTGPVLQWSDGMLAVPFESFKEYDDPRPARHAAWLMISRDLGESFSPPLLVAQHPEHQVYYWDQRLCVGTEPGSFTALFWTHDLAGQRDLNVHLRHGVVSGDTISMEPIRETSIPGQIAAPLQLPDGRLLAFVVSRHSPGTLTLWCSQDHGATWPASEQLVVYSHDEQAQLSQGLEQIDFKQYWDDMLQWTFGHPAIRRLSKTRLLLAWYAGVPGQMSLHWAQVDVGDSDGTVEYVERR